MRTFVVFGVIAASVFSGSALRAGTLTPVVDCGFTLKVNAGNDGETLTLDPSAPIFHKTCRKNGITITNLSAGSGNRSFTLDCDGAGTITGSGVGTGISVTGPSIAVYNCTVNGFANGIVATGKGADIEANTVESSVRKGAIGGNGFVIDNRAPANPDSDYYLDTFILGNTAVSNGGFGFKITGNGITGDSGSLGNTTNVSGNTSLKNGMGGFSVVGETDMMGSLDNGTQANSAISNTGPGISVVNTSCCFPNSLANAQVISNTGPGIKYVGRDDGTNCYGSLGGPPCYASGIDLTTPGGSIQSLSNTGKCPVGGGWTSNGTAAGQICVNTTRCSAKALAKCGF